MQLRFRTLIHKSLSEVWAAFEKPENLQSWQPSLKSIRHIEGKPGQQGAISELTYVEDGRDVILRERIRYRQERVALDLEYTSPLVLTHVENRFLQAEGGTMWVVETDHRFRGLYWFITPFMRSKIQRRFREDLDRFKTLVEEK